MRNGMRALAGVLSNATYRKLPGQTHMVNAKVVVPVVAAFFKNPSENGAVRLGASAAR